MKPEEKNNCKRSKSAKKFPRMFNNASNFIAVYTVFCILRIMREQLCLEAMLDYMGTYLKIVESNNPLLKESVFKALSMISIKKIYEDAML
ncbi:MAG: hypothetical protein JW847_00630 [Candidatus Omnitrophica bacterium]|nr:hypothetical protein [Candidatus Omnitrophota bacterium]